FSTRPSGAKLRKMTLEGHVPGDEIRVSFEGVQSISYSFADEFLGPLMLGADDVVLENVPPNLHRIILAALRRRGIRTKPQNLFGSVAA
ncbi:MAG TPA: STAS-like domain-containing protein, partial [Solirubrobacterales bacterium]